MDLAWIHVAVAGGFGGLLALERRAFLQAMLSRPLLAATLTGALVDDVMSGLFVGMVLELFHLGSASLGAAVPDNDTLAATGTAAGAAALAAGLGGSTPAIWSLALLLFAGLGPLGRRLDRLLDRHSGRLNRTAQSSADEGNLRRAVRQNLWGMYPHFLAYGAVTAGCYLLGAFAAPLLEGALVPRVLRGLTWAYPAMASVAAAIAARGSNARRAHVWAGAAAALVTTLAALAQVFGGGR
jgi:mannose/fructose/N-acetylgalactosamine-specific phosphotransferase system component IIC